MKTYTTEDKSAWGEGPWLKEPDKVVWVDAATDLDCMLHRGPGGQWCGYVGVTEGHPAFKKKYSDVDVVVHGGLTYAAFCQPTEDEATGICHVPEPGRPHEVYWLGFDCAHYMDHAPKFRAEIDKIMPGERSRRVGWPGYVYRTLTFAKKETLRLAKQLRAMAA